MSERRSAGPTEDSGTELSGDLVIIRPVPNDSHYVGVVDAAARLGINVVYVDYRVLRNTYRRRRLHLGLSLDAIRVLSSNRPRTLLIRAEPFDFRAPLFALLARAYPTVVYTSWPIYLEPDRFPRRGLGRLPQVRKAWWSLLAHASSIVTVTQHAASELAAVRPDLAVSTTVIPHVTGSGFRGLGSAHSSTSPRGRMLFVGRLERVKGAHLLPAILAEVRGHVPEATMTVVGSGGLGAWLKGLELEVDGLQVTGQLERAEVAAILREHDVLVVPTVRTQGLEEAYSMAVAEAMLSGMAVVAADHVGPRELLAGYPDGHVVPIDDIAPMAAKALAAPDSARDERVVAAVHALAGTTPAAVGDRWVVVLERAFTAVDRGRS